MIISKPLGKKIITIRGTHCSFPSYFAKVAAARLVRAGQVYALEIVAWPDMPARPGSIRICGLDWSG